MKTQQTQQTQHLLKQYKHSQRIVMLVECFAIYSGAYKNR